MRAEINLCIMREADQKVGRVLVPVDGGAGSGWVMVGGDQLPWAGLLEGRLYLFLFQTIRAQVVASGPTTRHEMRSLNEG